MPVGPHSERALFASEAQLQINWHFWHYSLQTEGISNLLLKVQSSCGAEGTVAGLILPVSPICWHYMHIFYTYAHTFIYLHPSAFDSHHQLQRPAVAKDGGLHWPRVLRLLCNTVCQNHSKGHVEEEEDVRGSWHWEVLVYLRNNRFEWQFCTTSATCQVKVDLPVLMEEQKELLLDSFFL